MRQQIRLIQRPHWFKCSTLCLLLAIVALTGCVDPPELPKGYEELRKKEPVSESFGVNYIMTENALPKVRLKAAHIYDMYEPSNKETITHFDKGIFLEFLDANGKTESVLTAKRAVMYDKRGYAEATGDVVVKNKKGDRMTTQKLYWYKYQDRLATNSKVVITTANETLRGDSMTANTKFNDYRLFKFSGKMKMSE